VGERADHGPQAADCAFTDLAQCGVEPLERLLDRVEVGAIGRKEAQGGTDHLDLLRHDHPLVARQVVHADDVTGAQFGHQDLRHVGFEPVAIDRTIQHRWRNHSSHTQAGHQCGGFAVAMQEPHAQALALWAPAAAAGHDRRGPRLVYEDEALWGEIELAVEPVLPLPQEVAPALRDRVPSPCYG